MFETLPSFSYPLNLNPVKERILSLSPTVSLGFERECNKNDFYRDGDQSIGSGTFGQVFKVVNKYTKKHYVIKVIDKSRINSQDLKNQLNREIKIMYSLNHPNIMKLINHFEDDNFCYLILPYASQGEIYKLLKKRQKFNEFEAAYYIRETVNAVMYLHKNKIIHRDIKPENLLLEKSHIILSDFGCAYNFNDNNKDEDEVRNSFCGSPQYISPEMLNKLPYNYSIDIWSIGVLLFEFLAGYPPFNSIDINLIYNNIKKCDFHYPCNFPEKAKDLINKILTINPNERLSLIKILEHPFITQFFGNYHISFNYIRNKRKELENHLILVEPEMIKEKIKKYLKENNENIRDSNFSLKNKEINNDNENLIKQIKLLKEENEVLKKEINNLSNYKNDIELKLHDINKNIELKNQEISLLKNKIREIKNKNKSLKDYYEKLLTSKKFIDSSSSIYEIDIIDKINNLIQNINSNKILNELKSELLNIINENKEKLKNKINIIEKKDDNSENRIKNLIDWYQDQINILIKYKNNSIDIIENMKKMNNDEIIKLKKKIKIYQNNSDNIILYVLNYLKVYEKSMFINEFKKKYYNTNYISDLNILNCEKENIVMKSI